jgi:hypothetical protein
MEGGVTVAKVKVPLAAVMRAAEAACAARIDGPDLESYHVVEFDLVQQLAVIVGPSGAVASGPVPWEEQ